MTTELTLLAWTLVLALVQVLLPATLRTGETGVSYNASARDNEGPPVGKVTGRLRRAQANLFETLPVIAAAILIAHVAGRNGALTWWGAMLYFWARVVYVPLYALGIPYVRSLVWLVSLTGTILILVAVLLPAA
ncbi:MAPEG family protein [Microvirga pakistanensis]|uniref:MAPEG family protein n=1 Tax=Microvirga pakistanensis TaxID=1682650 RepID=UPI001069BD9B|nr:MAPEG family protein [Microvirga pakistanensis]